MTSTVETLRGVLGWTALINYALLALWFLVFLFAHDWLYNLHEGWFDFPVQTFDTVHYTAMAIFDLGTIMFFLVPWVALLIVGRRA